MSNVLEQALEALMEYRTNERLPKTDEAIYALNEAIKQHGEPITIVTGSDDGCFDGMSDEITDLLPIGTKLYTSTQTIPDVDWLANVIRSVDGNHTLGAGALAEKIVEALSNAPKGE